MGSFWHTVFSLSQDYCTLSYHFQPRAAINNSHFSRASQTVLIHLAWLTSEPVAWECGGFLRACRRVKTLHTLTWARRRRAENSHTLTREKPCTLFIDETNFAVTSDAIVTIATWYSPKSHIRAWVRAQVWCVNWQKLHLSGILNTSDISDAIVTKVMLMIACWSVTTIQNKVRRRYSSCYTTSKKAIIGSPGLPSIPN